MKTYITQAKTVLQNKRKAVSWPIRAECQYMKKGIGLQLPKSIVQFLNIAPDWTAFEVSILENGILLKPIPKRALDF